MERMDLECKMEKRLSCAFPRYLMLTLILASMPLAYRGVFAFSYSGQIIESRPASTMYGNNECSVTVETNGSRSAISCWLKPSDDAFVDNLFPSKPFGGLWVLIVQNVPSVPISKNYAFLKFDLADSLPQNLVASMARPSNASLRLFVRLMNFYYNATVEIHNASPDNWTENAVTWNNMPQIGQDYASTDIRENGTWAAWNLTRIVQPVFNDTGQIAFAAISSETAWRNLIWFDSAEYPLVNGTTAPNLQLTFEEPQLTVETPYPNVQVSIGNKTLTTNANGTVRTLLQWGTYPLSVPDNIPVSNGTREAFEGWTDNVNSSTRQVSVGNDLTLTARYGIQHFLDAHSLYGSVSGEGWYFANAKANITVEPNSVPLEGLLGWLGGRHVFAHWSGDCNASSTQCSIIMNGPKAALAVWRVDWTDTLLVAALMVAGFVFLAGLRAHRRKARWKTKGENARRPRRHRVG